MIKLTRLELINICCFEKISLDFKREDKAVNVAVLLGNNGTGKTSIMRSITLGLCDPSSSAGLLQELYCDMIRQGKEEGKIFIYFSSDEINDSQPYSIVTTLRNSPSGQIVIDQETNPKENFPWEDIFVCAYGAARGAFGTIDIREYSLVDSVYSLFNYDAKLQNSELIFRRLKDIDKDPEGVLKKLLNTVDNILMLPEGSTQLDKSGITVSGPWGKFMPHGSLGDGYRAMLALISDFLGWALFYDEKMFFDGISGIVLIDEIEQHLHPDWQRKVVRLLNKQFPKIQFILSTHSPLIASNTNKLLGDDFDSKLFHFKREDNRVISSDIEENLGGLDCDQILSSEAFDYIININPEIAETLKEASMLAVKKVRTDVEEKRLQNFKDALMKVMFPEGRTLIERIVEKEYYSELERKINDFKQILDR
jgi:hypothetical protein